MNPVVAFIPARKGSKGVIGKNTRKLAGKPLIAHTIEAALGCKRKLEILVSTNDPKVKEVAASYGLRVDYERPERLATDDAGMAEALIDGIEWLQAQKKPVENFVLLQPTSPFRTSADIEKGIELLESSGAPSVFGVSPVFQHPFECVKVNGDHWEYVIERTENPNRRQQYAGNHYFINGALYCGRWLEFQANRKFLVPESKLYVMDAVNTIDIDTELDFLIADAVMRNRGRIR